MVQDGAHVYKVVELVGSSQNGIEAAVENAIGRASETLRNLDWFEVREIRGNVQGGKVGWYQVKVGIGFQVLNPEDLHKEG
jgi:flavin-binding protein dodecin